MRPPHPSRRGQEAAPQDEVFASGRKGLIAQTDVSSRVKFLFAIVMPGLVPGTHVLATVR